MSQHCALHAAKNEKVTDTPQPSDSKAFELKLSINDLGSCSSISSLSITSNRIEIDRGTFLAKSPNALNDDWTTSASGCEFLESHTMKFFNFIGAKRRSEKKVELLDCILANLISAYGSHSQLLYSRTSANNSEHI